MKTFLIIVSSLLVIALGFELYSLWVRNRSISQELEAVQAKLNEAKVDYNKLQDELNYLANPMNLEKEIRARFNLKKEGEKSVVIIPKTTSTPN